MTFLKVTWYNCGFILCYLTLMQAQQTVDCIRIVRSNSSLSSNRTANERSSDVVSFPLPQLIRTSIVYPDDTDDSMLVLQNATNDEVIETLIRSSGASTINDFMDDLTSGGLVAKGRPKPMYTGIDIQAGCKPTATLVNLDSGEYPIRGAIYFPRCIRVQRCGGCCDMSGLMSCMPTNVTQQEVRRAKIRLRRSLDDVPRARVQVIVVEVHEVCACRCLVQASDCLPGVHVYRPELCRCECDASSLGRQVACSREPNKFWNIGDCTCKCRDPRTCTTNHRFSEVDCKCEPFFE